MQKEMHAHRADARRHLHLIATGLYSPGRRQPISKDRGKAHARSRRVCRNRLGIKPGQQVISNALVLQATVEQ